MIILQHKKVVLDNDVRLGPAQDAPFNIILWYTEKKSYFVGIGPIRDLELTCIFQHFFPLCTLYQR